MTKRRAIDTDAVRDAVVFGALAAIFVGIFIKGGYDRMKEDEERERDKTRIRWTDANRWD